MSIYKKVYFIGNGFDLHHGMHSGYNDFKEWLKTNRNSVFENLIRIYGDINDNWWCKFEENLSNFDPNKFPMEITDNSCLKQLRKLIERYEEEGRSFINDLELREGISNQHVRAGEIAHFEMKHLHEDLREAFGEWVKSIEIPPKTKMDCNLDATALFFTLNYTKTLESLYNIDESQVIHLHGSIDSREIIFGHHMTAEKMLERDMDNHMYDRNPEKDKGEFNARTAMFEVAEELMKPVERILLDFSTEFYSLTSVTELEVLGFSYSPIDLPYLERIIEITGNNITAKLGYHSEEDKCNLNDFAQKIGLKTDNMFYF